jgi:hypothetical protein
LRIRIAGIVSHSMSASHTHFIGATSNRPSAFIAASYRPWVSNVLFQSANFGSQLAATVYFSLTGLIVANDKDYHCANSRRSSLSETMQSRDGFREKWEAERSFERRGQSWALMLCAGDGIKAHEALVKAGISSDDAATLERELAIAEGKLPPEQVAMLSRFEGVLMMDDSGNHPSVHHQSHAKH